LRDALATIARPSAAPCAAFCDRTRFVRPSIPMHTWCAVSGLCAVVIVIIIFLGLSIHMNIETG
jgi:hypothetical protein